MSGGLRSKPSRRRTRVFAKLRERYGDNCWICGLRMCFDGDRNSPSAATFDHVIPQREGGPDAQANLRLAHRKCNEKRGKDWQDIEAASYHRWLNEGGRAGETRIDASDRLIHEIREMEA